ncbi:hypothetical protein GCM10023191_069990 [Actinoallomurus oryzae]|jgi:hypothetical protein|uniref:Secreted protein n=1 Tax=Actinoallomurus oryzae TaxID=502180 RepID=A0ABP8QUE8_9ACTN
MQFTNLRRAAAIACGGGMIALAMTACNADNNASKASNSSGAAGKASSVANSTHDKGPGAAYAGQDDTPACGASELRGYLQLQDSGSEQGDEAIATLTLTHADWASESCYLPAGWVPIGKGGPHDYTAVPSTRVNYPGPGMTITLRPGGSAFAGIKWHTEKGCPGGATSDLGFAWGATWVPLTYSGLDDGYQPPICDDVTLGTLQPTMNGVNFT